MTTMPASPRPTTPTDTPRSVQFNVRLTPDQIARLEEIAVEQNLLGGPGVRRDTPNLSLAARWLFAKADPIMGEHDVVLEWDRNG